MSEPIGALAPLKHPQFRFLMAGRVVSMFGNAMAPIALAFAVLDISDSAVALGLVVGARSLTNVLFLLFGGVLADRLPRHLVMVTASVLSCLTQALVAVLVLTHTATVPLLAIIGAVNGTVSAFMFPAAAAVMAQTVPDSIRRQANALNRLGINGAMILGASLGGLIVAGVGPGWGLSVDAFTFALAALFFSFVRVESVRTERKDGESTWTELREGWTEFWSRTWLWVVVLAFCFINMAHTGAIGVLGPALADDTFGRAAWGVLLAAITIGNVIGGIVAIRLKVRRLLYLGCACMIVEGLLAIALGLTPALAVLIPMAFLTGLAMEQFGVAWETSMQEHVPADKLARVYSYDALGSFLAIPVGQVLAGPAAKAFGTAPALVVAGVISVVASLGMLLSRDVRTLEHRPATQPPVEPAPELPDGEPQAASMAGTGQVKE